MKLFIERDDGTLEEVTDLRRWDLSKGTLIKMAFIETVVASIRKVQVYNLVTESTLQEEAEKLDQQLDKAKPTKAKDKK